jgi:UDP-N-acetylglucosamine--N-acetylmuramyl-(pentapeptide) pyrophosphoryl-undecaprenol N-acetylglucosamine transferase
VSAAAAQDQAAADCWAIIAGGGTGGHVQPALAIADALVGRGQSRQSIQFVGSRHGMEGRLVPAAGYAITLLGGRGIKRRFALSNLSAIFGLCFASLRALGLVRRRHPAVIVTVGGYAGFPAAFAGLIWRVPVLVVSYDAVAGAANRFIGRFAAANAVAYRGSGLPRSRVTGPPVRERVLAIERTEAGREKACEILGLDPDRSIVLATGGSLGARTINLAVLDLASRWSGRDDVTLYHVAGDRDLEEIEALAAQSSVELDYRLTGYETRMPELLAACDVVIARAGASTVAELAAVGVPSVLVPLPRSPGDHQTKNAVTLEEVGAAVMIPDAECTGERLAEVLEPLLDSEDALIKMGVAAAEIGHRDASDQIALLAMAIAKRTA